MKKLRTARSIALLVSFACVINMGVWGAIDTKDSVSWVDIQSYWEHPGASRLTYVDLFCGAGGLSKGLDLAGLQGVGGLDYFKEAGLTYKRNFKHAYIDGDVTLPETKAQLYKVVQDTIGTNHLSLIVGGFPCQGFSMAGNRVVEDPRNSLYREMVEIVRTLQPDYVICENVKGLRSMLGGAVEKKIISDFAAIGYEMNVTTLCAADYGVPQKRERVIFIGNRIAKRNLYPKPMLTPGHYKTVQEAIGDLMDAAEQASFNHVFSKHSPAMVEKMKKLSEGEGLYPKYSEAWRRCYWDKPSPTVKENHGGVIIHPKLPRVLTARELARLQSFPDDFIFEGSKTKQLVQIGNAVPVLLGKALGLAIRSSAGDLPIK